MISELGTAERSCGRTNERARCLPELLDDASVVVLGTVDANPRSDVRLDEYERRSGSVEELS